jgi:hypothetical protein
MNSLPHLPGPLFYLPALVLPPFVLGLLEGLPTLSKAGRFLLSILLPLLLITVFSPLTYWSLPSLDPLQLGRVFVPAFAGASLYGVALFERGAMGRLVVFGATAAVLQANLLVNHMHRFVRDSLPILAQLETEMALLADRVPVVGAALAVVILLSALLRGRGRPFRVAPDLIALLGCGAALFFPLPCQSRVSASEIASIWSPEISGEDLYLAAKLKKPAPRPSDRGIENLLRPRKGEQALACLWPCKSGFSRTPSDVGDRHPRFVVREQRWWYLLLGSHLAVKVLDARTGDLDTVFRDRLRLYAQRPGRYGWPTVLPLGPGRSWVAQSDREVWGRLASGGRFRRQQERATPWVQNGKLKVLSGIDEMSVLAAPTLTSVDLLTGEESSKQLPLPVRLEMVSPAGDNAVLSEWRRRASQSLRRLYWLDDRNDLVVLQDWSSPYEVIIVVCPENGKPMVISRGAGPGPRNFSGGSRICRVVEGQCLALERPDGHPDPRNFPRLLQLDLYSGAWKDVALVSGTLQWLGNSVVFAAPELRSARDGTKVLWSVVRYWPKDGRREVLFSLPEQDLER